MCGSCLMCSAMINYTYVFLHIFNIIECFVLAISLGGLFVNFLSHIEPLQLSTCIYLNSLTTNDAYAAS